MSEAAAQQGAALTADILPDSSGLPPWLAEQKLAAWQLFNDLPAPVRTDEEWRFSQLKALTLDNYLRPLPVSADQADKLVAASTAGSECQARLVFGNSRALAHDVAADFARSGVIFTSFENAFEEYGEVIRKHFMVQQSRLGSEKFAALHQALFESGTFLYVPDGVKLSTPVEAFHWLAGENGSAFPHTLIVAGKRSKVTLIDHFQSADDHPGMVCAVNDLYVGEEAEVHYVCIQNWSEKVLSFQLNSTVAEKNSSVASLNMNLGAGYSRVESRSRLNGSGASSDMLAVTIAENDQIFDMRTAQDHGERGTTSDLLYKNALSDQSKAIFSGIIKVEEGAHQTDAYQTNRSLMLSDEAESDSMPGLEILADDVKCSHGSTAGSMSEEELFYLLARGIPEKVAQQLVVVGFLNEVLNRLSSDSLADRLRDLIESRYKRIQTHQSNS